MLNSSFQLTGKKVFVAGHKGMVGSAIVRRLANEPCEIMIVERCKLDLRDQTATRAWIMDSKPDAIFLAAAKVGGIKANSEYPADFLGDNLQIEMNVINAAHLANVSKLLFLGSSCIYPKLAPQPISEDALLTGPLEPTNEWYAVAKVAGIKLCQAYRQQYGCNYISAMPTNLYGPGDNFNLDTSHVIPALIRKAHEAKLRSSPNFTIWGSGTPRREFLHVDDCADACVQLMKSYSGSTHINVGTGEDIAIIELARLIAKTVSFGGEIITDPSMPDGTPRKLLDISKIQALGWSPQISLRDGLSSTYESFESNQSRLRGMA